MHAKVKLSSVKIAFFKSNIKISNSAHFFGDFSLIYASDLEKCAVQIMEIQKYLAHPVLSISQTKFLFAVLAKMLFMGSNCLLMYSDRICLICISNTNKHTDNQDHLMSCEKLNINNTQIIQSEAYHEDLFSYNLEQDTSYTSYKQSPDTFQTPSRHPPDPCQSPT